MKWIPSVAHAVYTLILASHWASARFGQEHTLNALVPKVTQHGNIHGRIVASLLAKADSCEKLKVADEIAARGSKDDLDFAQRLVHAEQNYNDFTQKVPQMCDDSSLPKNPKLRCILPLVSDVASPGNDKLPKFGTLNGTLTADQLNKKAKASFQTALSGSLDPKKCEGQSVAAQLEALNFKDFLKGNGAQPLVSSAAAGNISTNATSSMIPPKDTAGNESTPLTGNATTLPTGAESVNGTTPLRKCLVHLSILLKLTTTFFMLLNSCWKCNLDCTC